jgi:uncharacterized damage-inducible protein DinB
MRTQRNREDASNRNGHRSLVCSAPMSRSVLQDAFEHHVWATVRLLDACNSLTREQLDTAVPGTYGSILQTARHLVASDSWYLHRLTGRAHIDEEGDLDVSQLREAMEGNGAAWSELLKSDPDADSVVVVRLDDGTEFHAALGIRLAQVVHHGTDHRSQICTGLSTLGVEPPAIDVWDFGEQAGRTKEVAPPAS